MMGLRGTVVEGSVAESAWYGLGFKVLGLRGLGV